MGFPSDSVILTSVLSTSVILNLIQAILSPRSCSQSREPYGK